MGAVDETVRVFVPAPEVGELEERFLIDALGSGSVGPGIDGFEQEVALHRLDAMIERRRALRERHAKLFASVDGVSILGADDPGANCGLTATVVDPAAIQRLVGAVTSFPQGVR
jgi:hypothetical protein